MPALSLEILRNDSTINKFEPTHEIMALFILCKLILQMCMCSHPVELDVWFLVGPFVYFHTSCVRTAKALARLRGCAASPEPSLVAYVISTIILWAGSNKVFSLRKCILFLMYKISVVENAPFIWLTRLKKKHLKIPQNNLKNILY